MTQLNGDRTIIQELLVEVAVLNIKVEERDKALKVQASEYERRLDDLNHAHAEAQRVLNTYLPREIHEKSQTEFRLWQTSVDKEMDQNRGRNSTFTSIAAAALSIAAIGLGLWNAVARIFIP